MDGGDADAEQDGRNDRVWNTYRMGRMIKMKVGGAGEVTPPEPAPLDEPPTTNPEEQ
jgi:hypothetical protein